VTTKAKRPDKPVEMRESGKRYGLGAILLTIALSTGVFAALGVLAAHVFH